jgi:hypothetical protein
MEVMGHTHRTSVGKPEKKRPLGRWVIWEDNIKMDRK